MKRFLLIFFIQVSVYAVSQNSIEHLEFLFSEDKVPEAEIILDKLLETDSLNSKLLIYKAIVTQDKNNINTPPSEKKENLDLAFYFFYKAYSYDTAQVLSTIIREHMRSVNIQYQYTGIEFFNSGNYKNALSVFEKNIEISELPLVQELDTMVWYNAAITAEKLEDYQKSEYYYTKILKYNKNELTSELALAHAYKKQNKIQQYKKMIRIGLEKPLKISIYYYNEVISYFMEINELDSAIFYIDNVILKDPSNDKMYYLKGSIYQEMSKIQLSNDEYKKCLKLNPENTDAAFNLSANFYNHAIDYLKKEKISKKGRKEMVNNFKTSIFYLKMVLEKEEHNQNVLAMLLVCYQELNMKKEEKEIQKRIDDLK